MHTTKGQGCHLGTVFSLLSFSHLWIWGHAEPQLANGRAGTSAVTVAQMPLDTGEAEKQGFETLALIPRNKAALFP